MALRFTVGQLAALSGVSKQTLIYYDREGVFQPEQVDSANGYRYYTAGQLEVLDSILILKEIGLSLREIKEFMAERNEKSALAMLRSQQTRLKRKIDALALVAGRLAHKIKTLEQFDAHSEGVQWCYQRHTQPLALQPVRAPGGLLEVDLAVKQLFQTAQTSAYVHFYQIGTMIRVDDLQRGDYLRAAYTFFPLEKHNTAAGCAKKPPGWYATYFHRGSYESIGRSYRVLLDAIRERGATPIGHSYEYCILDNLTNRTNADYVTEIQILVEGFLPETPSN